MTRRARIGWLAVAGLLCLALLSGIRWGDPAIYPPRGPERIAVILVSNGFHAGLLLPRRAIDDAAGRSSRPALIDVVEWFRAYEWLEIGWGDGGFYRAVPNVSDLDWRLGLRALAGLGGEPVLHVVGIAGDPAEAYAGADRITLALSVEGFGRLLDRLDSSFAHESGGRPTELGSGLYGPSLFYRARGRFFFGNLCNHWIAGLLDAAGVPTSPLLATIPRGLLWDLTIRSGLLLQPARPTIAQPDP